MTAPMTSAQSAAALLVLDEVMRERRRQHEKWGEQNHPDGTGLEEARVALEAIRDRFFTPSERQQVFVEAAMMAGTLTYSAILLEEALEALEESDPARLRAELVQLAAVAVQWIEKLDREGA